MTDDRVPEPRPQGAIKVIVSPPWWTELAAARNGSIVQIHHPDHGWLSFLLPPEWAGQLGLNLIKQTVLVEYFSGAAPPSTEAVN